MIVNVNMCASLFDETFHVLKFSAIAKKVEFTKCLSYVNTNSKNMFILAASWI